MAQQVGYSKLAGMIPMPVDPATMGIRGTASRYNYQTAMRQYQSQQSIMGLMEQAQTEQNVANKAREEEVRKLLDQVVGMYEKGGSYGKGFEEQLERERTKALSTGGQALISSGLYGTTQLAGLGGRFAEEVAAPARMKLEDLRAERLSQALGQKAGFVTGIQNIQPDYTLLASLLSKG